MANIILSKFKPHVNRAMGKYISTQRQYNEEMKRGGYVTKDKADAIAKAQRAKTSKPYTPSQRTRGIINSLHPDRQGNVKLSDRAIDGLKDMGVTFDAKKIKEQTTGPNLGD